MLFARRPPADTSVVAPRDTPATVRSFSHAGATLVAESFGRGARTFLLIHGLGMGRLAFRGLAGQLRGRGRFIAVDLPGYGAAPEPERTLTMARTADLLAALLRDSGEGPVVAVGHSMGTQVAVELAARHPALVDSVVLLAPTVTRAERTAARQILRLAQDLAVESPRVILVGAIEYLRAGPNLRGKFRAMLAHRPEDVYPRVTQRALVIRGGTDRVCPQWWCAEVAAALHSADLVVVDHHGHETMIRDSAPSAAAILAFTGG
ncbi:alpha/beta hydrolase [Microbacterium sp. 1P10UB]|uniref:alpha/beta fold hydrolase n=1 Tax=unclassified Microbacterium TaxID=2609290 RepID=UPI0039A3F022